MARSGPSESNHQPEPAPERVSGLSIKLGVAGLVFFSAIFVAVALFTGGSNPDTRVAADSLRTVLGVSTEPAVAEPTRTEPSSTRAPIASSINSTPAIVSVPGDPRFSTSQVTQPPTPTALSTSTNPPVVTNPPTIGTTATQSPVVSTPSPVGGLSAVAAALATQIETEYSVRVVADGQDWGSDEQRQLRNLGALKAALDSMPSGVMTEIVAGPGGALTFLSNNHGRTEDGWQPYGDRAANFYSNEDRGTTGSHRAHQIVLQTGSTAQTIAHEMTHAYQMRGVDIGEYVEALLTPEMKSFMAATGWTQLVSDGELRANADQSWATINELFEYTGRDLTYVNEFGTSVSLYGPNPLEGYAEAAGLYFAHSAGTTLPDWPEYWSWFDSNLD